MSKKKRFGISEALTRGLSETIHVVENNQGVYRNIILPLSRIELDPDNPRKLAINLADVRQGIKPEDALFPQKQDELERLRELAHTIKTNGVINPVVVYKRGEIYRVVAGERRCLASILAGKQEIEARVFNEKPKGYELKLVQWIENTAREDLTLEERIGNVRDIIHEYKAQKGEEEITATALKNMIGLSLSQSTYYLAVLNAPEDVQVQIRAGHVKNLDKAALLANVDSSQLREQLTTACINGASLKELRLMINQNKSIKKHQRDLAVTQRGRDPAKIHMGSTVKVEVIKTLIESVLAKGQFDRYVDLFTAVNWMDLRQATKAFRKLIEILEVESIA